MSLDPAYLIGKCVDQREESALAILCAVALKRRERDYEEVHSRNFVTSFTIYNKDKVPVDVAT